MPKSITPAAMTAWCQKLLGVDRPRRTLAEYLSAIDRLDALADVPSCTVVLVRGDVDAKPGKKVGEGDIRLRSMLGTLNFGRERGWKQVVFGHRGRKPEESLSSVAQRLGELLSTDVPLVKDWFDPAGQSIRASAQERIAALKPGDVAMLENMRQYECERLLWDAKPDDVPAVAERLARVGNEFAAKLGTVYVNEALSAGSFDSSTLVVPAAMDRVALGHYVAAEFAGPMTRCLQTELVVFSGLKIDKLDDLSAMIGRGTIRIVVAAGSLAMALLKGAAAIDGRTFCMGVAEDAAHAGKPYYIPPDRVEQARRMIEDGRRKEIEFVLPVDFVLQDGRAASAIGPADQQFDVGPKTREHFAAKVGQFIDSRRGRRPVVFYNGVFGMFEDPRFEEGTRHFIGQLKRLTDAGAEVYVGGGEGGTALEKYGQPSYVTHCFTAGGTVLNALGSEPVPYLVALSMASGR